MLPSTAVCSSQNTENFRPVSPEPTIPFVHDCILVGWLFFQDHFAKKNKMSITLKYIGSWPIWSLVLRWLRPRDNTGELSDDNWLLKLADPTYMIRAIPSNAADNVYCTLLAQSAVHGAMAGYTGFTVGLVNGRHSYIPFNVSFFSSRFIFPLIFWYQTWQYQKIWNLNACLLRGSCWQRITEKQNKVVITDRMWARLLSSTNQPSFLSPKDVIEDKKDELLPGLVADLDGTDDYLVNKEISDYRSKFWIRCPQRSPPIDLGLDCNPLFPGLPSE